MCHKHMKNSAPSIDRVLVGELCRVDGRILSILFKSLLGCGNLPSIWKRKFTILIPKTGGDLSATTCWRPLTISSILVILFHAILAHRFSNAYPPSPFQQAFKLIDGITTSIFALLSLVRHHHRPCKSLYIGSLDVSKAFHSVSHNSIKTSFDSLGCSSSCSTLSI